MKRGVTILNWQRKCILTTLLVLSSLFLVFSTITYASERDFKDSLKITTHNVYFLPTAIYPNWGQSQRADLISKADYIGELSLTTHFSYLYFYFILKFLF